MIYCVAGSGCTQTRPYITYSLRSVPAEQQQQTLLIHDDFRLLVGSTKSSFSSSSTSSRCLCVHGRGQRATASLTGCVQALAIRAYRMGGLEMRTIHQSAAARLLYQAPPARAVIAAEYLGLQAVDSWGCRRCRHRRARAAGGAGAGDTAAEQSSAHLIGNGDRGVALVPGGCKPLCTHTTPGQRSQPASHHYALCCAGCQPARGLRAPRLLFALESIFVGMAAVVLAAVRLALCLFATAAFLESGTG